MSMHHRKQGSRIPWCGMVRYPDRPEFRIGTVHTSDYDASEAKRLLTDAAAERLPAGFTIGHVERGALIYQPHRP